MKNTWTTGTQNFLDETISEIASRSRVHSGVTGAHRIGEVPLGASGIASLTVRQAGLASCVPVIALADEQRRAAPVSVKKPG